MREKHRETAIKQVKRNLILGKVIAQEKLELTDEEYEVGLADMAASFNQPVSDIKGYYASPENKTQLAYFRYTLLEKKAAQLIVDGSDIEDVTPELLKKTEAAEDPGSD
jgi:trigger factor